MSTPQEALARAIAAVGTAAEFSRRMGITEQAISQWEIVPILRVLTVERITSIPRHELRPDVYPPPPTPPQVTTDGQPPTAQERVA